MLHLGKSSIFFLQCLKSSLYEFSKLSIIRGIEVYLFGSYSKLIYNEKSDVDIAILTSKTFDKKNIQKITQKLEIVYKKSIELHFFEKKLFYKNKKDPLVKEIMKNGVRII